MDNYLEAKYLNQGGTCCEVWDFGAELRLNYSNRGHLIRWIYRELNTYMPMAMAAHVFVKRILSYNYS